MSMWRGEAMDEDKFTAVMLALGYEQHIIDQFNMSINRTDDETMRIRARKSAIVAKMEDRPYWVIGKMIDDICSPVSG